ncbi:MAG: ATP-binding protein [Cyanobacteriota bacterium]|nr:ATP-binding protein [Cyanobacteriota bacterium]
MASIDEIIQREVNPFDSTTFRPGNFWREEQDAALRVDSIHQQTIADVEKVLGEVAGDRRTRTILLAGDSGAGKSYLLGRLKSTLNASAFFAYIGPWPESDFIWRHTLRNVVDSLTCIPAGGRESQLLLWLKGLSAFRKQGVMKQLLGERNLFIRNLKGTYPSGIYHPNEFFGILYHLTNPELYHLACDWLKGDHLDEESLQALQVKTSIDTEIKAQHILANFGRISTATQPIVLCFDNLDNLDRTEKGSINLQALFHVNSIVHNQKLKNFLILISIITNTWTQNSKFIQPADLARINTKLRLRPIDLDQAESLWASQLTPLHRQAKSSPPSPIYPLTRNALEEKFPGGKTLPRPVLMLGCQLFQKAKDGGGNRAVTPEKAETTSHADTLAAFRLLWRKERRISQEKVTQIRHFSGPELTRMLQEALETLEVATIKPKLLPSPTYASHSMSYHAPLQPGQIGLIWMEEPNLVSFCHVMKNCQKVLKQNRCQSIQLIRAEKLGVPRNQGYQRYQKLFSDSNHQHIVPDLDSVRDLAAYHSLLLAARSEELVLGDRLIRVGDLVNLARETEVLKHCKLLYHLGVLWEEELARIEQKEKLKNPIEAFISDLIETQKLMGRQVIFNRTSDHFTHAKSEEIEEAIEKLCQDGKVQVLGDETSRDAQLLSWID